MSRLGRQESAREFLEGLSTDELQYIAAYFGARTLDPELSDSITTRQCRARAIERYEESRATMQVSEHASSKIRTATKLAADVSHRMIVLLEFLTINERAVANTKAWPAASGRG